MTDTTIDQIRAVLQKFQEGYSRRDLKGIDEFMSLFVPEETVEVIGTGAENPGEGEWCLGQQAVRNLVSGDWEGWGDVSLDVENARIYVSGDVGWLATQAKVTYILEPERAAENYLKYLPNIERKNEMNALEKLHEIARGSIATIYEAQKGNIYVWPLRFTATLVKREGRWLFHQITFSFPTTHFPDVRKTGE